ncbi:MAG: SgcJ/EcaC family oxidoreductase [Flavobacterium sp.]|uniref:YybH family protein n=1 Tax=Flavobacterium sp. TaxID=239 RepID=UPI0032671AF0
MKKIQLLNIALALFILTAVSCKKAEETPVSGEPAKEAFDLAATKPAIEERYRAFENAFNAKDSTALANCYTTDAKFMNPNDKSAEGRPAIQKTFGMWFKGDTSKTKIKLNLVELWGDENTLTAEDAWTMTDKDGKLIDEGKSLEVYKMEDGKWLLYRDCYNSNMPAMPMK